LLIVSERSDHPEKVPDHFFNLFFNT
jgi:hypothetical protein